MISDPRLEELLAENATQRDSGRENEIKAILRKRQPFEKFAALRSMWLSRIRGVDDLASALLVEPESSAFFAGLVVGSDASSLEFALQFGERKLRKSTLIAQTTWAMLARPELLSSLKYWRPELFQEVTAHNVLLLGLSDHHFTRTQP